MRDINLCAGPFRQFAKTGRKIGVRMAVENGDYPEAFTFRFGDVIVDVAFRIDDGGFAVRSEEVGSVSKSFNKESF